MPLILPTRNPLAYPAGVAPGFDPTHVAARGMSPGNGFSGVANGGAGGFVNLLKGTPGALTGTPSNSLRDIGNTVLFNSFSQRLKWSGNSTANPNVGTTAAIVISTATAALSQVAVCSGGSGLVGAGVATTVTTNALGVHVANIVQISATGITVPTNEPVLIIASFKLTLAAGDGVNFVMCRLKSGIIQSEFVANSVQQQVTPDGTYTVGDRGDGNRPFNGYIAAAMYAPSYLSISELRRWAADPWSFWYPRQAYTAEGFAGQFWGGVPASTPSLVGPAVMLMSNMGATSIGRSVRVIGY